MTATITCTGCHHGYVETALFCPNCGRPKARDASHDALIGKLLGERFQVQALLGQGASGTIYRAEHITLRRRVAIKVLHTELSRDDLAVERFRREATMVADLDNEHIVEIHDFGRTPDGRLYLAMELLEGEGLDAVVAREGQLSIERTADILIQVGEALMEAHAIGYVHRDLRPRNVYLTQRRAKANFVKLLDFGLAKLVESDTQAASTSLGMTFGDPRYMSPEQARGDRIDRRADIYQLGCVAYEMLTGAPPFTGSRVFDILTKQVTEPPVPLPTRRPGVPLWMEAAIAKMLAKDPDNRFATTSRMVEALRRGLETGEVMEDEVARRRESVPPPSVSRVMQRLGLTPEVPLPPPAAAAPPEPAVSPSEAALPPPVGGSSAASHAASEPAAPPRRSTGTPRVGVPIVPAPVAGAPSVEPPAQPPVAGTIEPPATRRPEPAVDDDRNISQVWYDEGEQASDAAERAAAGRRAAGEPAFAGRLAASASGELTVDDDEDALPRGGRRWGLIAGVVAALGLGGVIALAMSGGGEAPRPKVEPPPIATAPPVEPPPSRILSEQGDPAVAAPDAERVAVAPPTPASVAPPSGSRRPAPSAPSTPGRDPAPRTPASRAPRPAPRPAGTDTGSLVPGSDSTFRRPGGESSTAPVTAPVNTPPPRVEPARTGVSGVDGPLDPYGAGADPAPSDSSTGEQKATFFANLGAQQLASGDAASAAASFQKALGLDARNAVAIAGLGEIALRQGLFGDALAHLRRAARLAPRNARVLTLLGEAYLNTGNYVEAEANFKKALQLDPDNARARDGYNEASSRVPPPADD